MKDFSGNIIDIGDTVAIIYHPEAYKFSIETAKVVGLNKQGQLVTQVTKNGAFTRFNVGTLTPGCFAKAIKIDPEFPPVQEGVHKDAVGHVINIGDKVFAMRPIEGGGNTLKGFMPVGTVTKLSDKYVFYEDSTGMKKRKGYNGVVVPLC